MGRTASGRRAAPSQFVLQMLENAMLSEALRRSVHHDTSKEDETARKAARGAEVLARLPRESWSPDMQNEDQCQGVECALCLDEYKAGEEVLKLPCGHFFHEGCVSPWFAKSLLCPLCNQDVSPAEASDSVGTAELSSG